MNNNNEAFEFGSQVKTGSEKNKLFIFLTSITSIMFMAIDNVPHHIDCTYKLCERDFPLIVFGLSDLAGQFFPVSHEQEDDFTRFFQTLLQLCQQSGIVTSINYLIQEACGASANAAISCLGPNIKILMCYFHVVKNVKELLKGINENIKSGIVKDLNYMHFCRNQFEFEIAKYNIYKKWEVNDLVDFKNYFDKQWVVNDKFYKWVFIIIFIIVFIIVDY